MKTFRKAPWVISVASLGMLIGAVVVESVGPASAAPPVLSLPVSGTVTANQGTAGTSAWPIIGSVSVSNFPSTQPVSGSVSVSNFPSTQTVSGNVGITSSLPEGTNDIGEVTVESPQPYYNNCEGDDTAVGTAFSSCYLSKFANSTVLQDVSLYALASASSAFVVNCLFGDSATGDVVYVPMVNEGDGYFEGNVSNVDFYVSAGDSNIYAACNQTASVSSGQDFSITFTANGYLTS